MTLLRELIDIPASVGEGDFVVKAVQGADLRRYVVTDQLRDSFTAALKLVRHAVTTGQSQAAFLHGSFGSGKSHFMAVLREILRHNPAAREVRGLAGPVLEADPWLGDRKLLTLTFHMLDAVSVEQAILEGYLNQITALHPEAPAPAVHRSDALLADAARLRDRMGDDAFFAALREGGAPPPSTGAEPDRKLRLSQVHAQAAGWTPQTYANAAADAPGTEHRDRLVSALTSTFFTGAVRSAEYLDLDTGLAVITRHAKALGYDAIVLFLDELILWLSGRISDHVFVNTEGAKLNKLIESADAARPMPLVSFVARQRNLEEFLGPQVGGTEKEALAHVMRSVQGRFGEIALADTNLPEITEKRLLKPVDDTARATIDAAFRAVRGNRAVWDTLLLGAQYGDAGIGSDASAFRKLYPFSPALVATLVALSQALQRERTALKVMTELLVDRRDTLRVNDLIGVAALFEPLVLHGELPDRPELKQLFQAARTLYLRKLRPVLRNLHGIGEEQTAGHVDFQTDDKLIKTVLLGALVPEVPALHNLTAGKLHALNFGTITSPIPGYEHQTVLNRLKRVRDGAGELHVTDAPDPVVSVSLYTVDYDKLLELVPDTIADNARQALIRDLVSAELGLATSDAQLGEVLHPRDWRGRRHFVQVRFGNIRDRGTMPVDALIATGDGWRVVIDYPFDPQGYERTADRARIDSLDPGSRSVFWLPYYLTDELMVRVTQLVKINYLLAGTGEKLNSLARDWSISERQQGRLYLQQRQAQLRETVVGALRQAYGVGSGRGVDGQTVAVQEDGVAVLHTLAEGLQLGEPRGGTLAEAFVNLTGEMLTWSYPGRPAMPDDEKPVTRNELNKIYEYAQRAAADPTRGVSVPAAADQRTLKRVCNHLRLGELRENRYVLTTATCWWSQHLLQVAANDGYTENFPVGLLRQFFDRPASFGFDRELQNLIIAVFALEQQLAWYERGGPVQITSLAAIHDNLELRHPPMPDEQEWIDAVRRGQAIFGEKLPSWRTPANLGPLASAVRGKAGQRQAAAADLADKLAAHADDLGLDHSATVGRLATARRMARLVRELANEGEDVVLVKTLARADLGELDEQAAGAALAQAGGVAAELGRDHYWPVFQAIAVRAGSDLRAREINDRLRLAARHEQHGTDLAAALSDAFAAATALLAADRPALTPRPDAETTGGTESPTSAGPPGSGGPGASGAAGTSGFGALGGSGAAGTSDPTGGGGTTVGGGQSYETPVGQQTPPRPPLRGPHRVEVDKENWAKVADQIAAELAAGRRVILTWEAR